MGDIGFAFGGAVHDDTTDSQDWAATPILIESVTRGSIAEKAGLEPGDEIMKVWKMQSIEFNLTALSLSLFWKTFILKYVYTGEPWRRGRSNKIICHTKTKERKKERIED